MTDTANDLMIDRILKAPRMALWRCWTEPELLEQWFCPKPWYVTNAVIDLRPGGEFSTVMHGPDGEKFLNSGVFLEIVEGKKLVTTDAFAPGWHPKGQPFMASIVTFEDAGDGRTQYVASAMHWSEEARKQHEDMGFYEGWNAVADQLETLAQTL